VGIGLVDETLQGGLFYPEVNRLADNLVDGGLDQLLLFGGG
jgi:hypothetical protein